MVKTLENKTTFSKRYSSLAQSVDNALEDYLAQAKNDIPDLLHEAMTYSLKSGGKRLRPIMVILSCQSCKGLESAALPAAAAMEMVHTYSLIHDDLPAMDDDDLRRGQPTSHKVFGDGVAILAGDALLTYAFNILALQSSNDKVSRQLILELAHAAGPAGMIGGQVADISAENTHGDLKTVDYIHTHKTAMMFRAATRMGAISAQADPTMVDLLGEFGLKLGLAFQIVDDLLDITATTQEMGKQARKDLQDGKLTYPSVIGLDQSQQRANELLDQAIDIIAPFKQTGQPLRHLAEMLVNRKK